MKPLRFLASTALVLAGLVGSIASAFAVDDDSFYLKDGDRVVFYGDSITDQMLYTTFTETYAVTRFPNYKLTFTNSAWSGDRVSGGAGGPIDRRLARDVIPYRPSVVTIMLGMNDGAYQPFKEEVFGWYTSGYRHIIDELKLDLPGVRLTLIKPSPYDDITREPKFAGGYNAVLVRYGEFLGELARSEGTSIADMNNPMVEATKKAFATDKEAATKFNSDRVHPGAAGQLIMTQALLQAWHAPSLVASAHLDAQASRVVSAEGTVVTELKKQGEGLGWIQLDHALPYPVDLKDPVLALATKSSGFFAALNRQPLQVDGLSAQEYTLKIDGREIGTFTREELSTGVNLAEHDTPMFSQALKVQTLTGEHNELHKLRWRKVQVPFQNAQSDHLAEALAGLDGIESELVTEQRAAAQPISHKFDLIPQS